MSPYYARLSSHRRISDSDVVSATGCPLTALALGRLPADQDDLLAAERIARERLARRGFAPAEFYAAWDAGLIGWRELLRRLDQHIIHRTLGKPPARTGGRDGPHRG